MGDVHKENCNVEWHPYNTMFGSAPAPSAPTGSQPEPQPIQPSGFTPSETQGPSLSLFGSSNHPVISSGLFGSSNHPVCSSGAVGSSSHPVSSSGALFGSSTTGFRGIQPGAGQTSSFGGGQAGGFGSAYPAPVQYVSAQPGFGVVAPTQSSYNFPQSYPSFNSGNPAPLTIGVQQVPYPTDPKPTHSQILTCFELEGQTADLKLSVGGRQFKVCSVLVFQRSKRLQREFEGKKSEQLTHEVDLPLITDPEPFVRWLHDIDGSALVESIKSFDQQVDLLALAVYFDIQPELHLEARVLSASVSVSASLGYAGLRQGLPPCWDRAYLPFPLILQILQTLRKTNSSGLFSNSSFNLSQPAQCALEWLGERRCFSAEEIEELRQSVEFKKMKTALQENYIMPPTLNDFLILAKRYPIAIDVFSVGDVFRSIGLI